MKPIAVITGTGSSGTTFLIRLCSELKYCRVSHLFYNEKIGGGLESFANSVEKHDQVFKDPRLFFGGLIDSDQKLRARGRSLDFVFVCHRSYQEASRSRIARNVVFDKWNGIHGVGNTVEERQIDFFRKGLQTTVEACLFLKIDFCFVDYERLCDPLYCYEVLSKYFKVLTIEEVKRAHASSWKSDMKHSYK